VAFVKRGAGKDGNLALGGRGRREGVLDREEGEKGNRSHLSLGATCTDY